MEITAQTVGLAVGWLLVGAAGAQLVLLIAPAVQRQVRSRQLYVRDRAEFCRRVESTAREARAAHLIPDWEGWRSFRVAAVVDEARDVKSFYLTPVDGRPLSPFAPGQHLTFRLPLPDCDAPLVRCYSLSDRPRQDYFRTTIKRIAAPPDRPDVPPGRGSNFFHQRVHVGDVLEARAPAGTFLLDPHASEPIALVGAGIGITPLVSMLEAVVHTGKPRDVYALFCFRNGREHSFKAQLERLVEACPTLRLQVSYSAPTDRDVLYKDYSHRGRLTIERIREVLPSNNFRFYVCGPGPFMDSLVPALWAWGVPKTHVQFEAFGPSSVRCGSSSAQSFAEPCEVRFERSNRVAMWDGSFGSLLEFGASIGISLPSGCRAGNCGECMTAIGAGAVTNVKKPGLPVPSGHCLACISVPAGPLVLEA